MSKKFPINLVFSDVSIALESETEGSLPGSREAPATVDKELGGQIQLTIEYPHEEGARLLFAWLSTTEAKDLVKALNAAIRHNPDTPKD